MTAKQSPADGRSISIDTLTRVCRTFLAATDEDGIYAGLTEVAVSATDADYCAVVTIGPRQCRIRAERPAGITSSVQGVGPLPEPLEGLIGEPLLRHAAEMEGAELLPDTHDVRGAATQAASADTGRRFRSVMVVPVGDTGVLLASARAPNAFDEADRRTLEAICDLGANAIETVGSGATPARDEEFHRELIKTFSHDVRTPLNVAMGHVDLAKQSDADPAEHLEWIEKSLTRIDELFDRLSRLVIRGELLEQQSTVDIEAVASRIWSTMQTEEATLSTAPMRIEADERGLGQLLENLFKNSLMHAGEDVAVSIGPLPDGTGFYVADDGPGIGDVTDEELFSTRYSTTSDQGGMGLAIVERIVTAHGWDVVTGTDRSGGARFEFRGVTIVDESTA